MALVPVYLRVLYIKRHKTKQGGLLKTSKLLTACFVIIIFTYTFTQKVDILLCH